MKTFVLLFVMCFIPIVVWRNFLTSKKERKLVKVGIREVAIAAAVSTGISVLLFFTMFNNTVRLV